MLNIVTTYPTYNLNTANVHTEGARRDNQLRDLITPTKQAEASARDPRVASEQDKTKQPGTNQTLEADSFKPSGDDNPRIEERGSGSQEQSDTQQERNEQQEKEQKLAQKEQEKEQKEQQALSQLKQRDAEVRAHEQAHASVGGQYAGSPSYEFERGSDGNNYAVAGEVPIDVAAVPNDPQQTIEKMQQVRAAALAPQEPSGADRAIAAEATQQIAEAQAELTALQSQKVMGDSEGDEKQAEQQNMLAQRDSEVNQRAERIAKFYQAVSEPFARSNIASYA